MKRLLVFGLFYLAFLCIAQLPCNAFKVIHGTDTLAFPWIGGLDNPRFNNLDLNADGKNDIVIFDRKDQKILPFVHTGNIGEVKYRFAPEYIPYFPKDIQNWMLILDYNCDNQPDIFCRRNYSSLINVYKNTTQNTGYLSFELVHDTLWVDNMFNSFYPLVSNDIPAIADVDFDGDIDFLTQDGLGSRIELNRNEASFCGDFDLKLHSMCWGHFSEVSTEYAGAVLNQPCYNEYKTMHQGGAYLALSLNGDTLIDFILTDDGPTNAVALYNGGTRRIAHFTQKDTAFPSYDQPVNLHYFPALFHVDVDADGLKDLVAAVNGIDFPSPNNPTYALNSGEIIHFYKNSTNNSAPIFQLQKKDIFIDQTIDGGSHAIPLIWDEDRDGDLDLLILTQQKTIWTGLNYAQRKEWRFYENITNNLQPIFKLVTSNYKGFNNLVLLDTLKSPYPVLADIDNDGDLDLFVGHYDARILFLENISSSGSANFQLTSVNYLGTNLTGKGCFPHFADIDNDNDLDLLIGRENGKITFVKNIGNPSSAVWDTPIYNWGGVDVSDYFYPVANAKPFWFDYNQDGNLELLVGNTQGEIHVYEPNGTNFLHKGILFNERISESVSPFFVKFHSSDSVSIFVGCSKGGIYLYRIPQGFVTHLQNQDIAWKVNIYPNPVKDFLTIQTNYQPFEIEIYNLLGQKIYQKNVFSNEALLNTKEWDEGLYFLKLTNQNNVKSLKFLKISYYSTGY